MRWWKTKWRWTERPNNSNDRKYLRGSMYTTLSILWQSPLFAHSPGSTWFPRGQYILPYAKSFSLSHATCFDQCSMHQFWVGGSKGITYFCLPFCSTVIHMRWTDSSNSYSFSLDPEWGTHRTHLNSSPSSLVELQPTGKNMNRKETFLSIGHWDFRIVCYATSFQQNLIHMTIWLIFTTVLWGRYC